MAEIANVCRPSTRSWRQTVLWDTMLMIRLQIFMHLCMGSLKMQKCAGRVYRAKIYKISKGECSLIFRFVNLYLGSVLWCLRVCYR